MLLKVGFLVLAWEKLFFYLRMTNTCCTAGVALPVRGVFAGGCCGKTQHLLSSLMVDEVLAVMGHWASTPARVLDTSDK